MANLQSDNMTILSARLGIARLGVSRMGAAPTQRNRLADNGTLLNKRPLPNDGDPDDSTTPWTNERS